MVGVTPGSGAFGQALTGLRTPLVRQCVLLVPVSLDLLLLLLWGSPSTVGPFYLAGLALLGVATVVASSTVLLSSLPRLLVVALPVVDLAAIGLMRLVPDGNGLGVLAVLPAMWLAADHRMRGVGIGLLTTLALVSAPSLWYFGMDVAWWSRALLVPAIVGMCAITVAGTTQLWERQNQALEEQGRRLEQALAEVTANQALNQAIVTTVDVGLVALDRNGDFRVVNPRHHEFLDLAFPDGHPRRAGEQGYSYAPNRATLLPREDMPTVRAMAGEEFSDCVIWVGRDPESRRALSVSAKPVLDAAGEFDGAVLAYQDVTDLMSALRIKDDFVASVSHELRTPLTAIMGFLDLVLDEEGSVSPSARQQLCVVKRNSERLLRLVSDLLFAAQVREGRLALDVERFDLAELAWQAVADHAPRAATESVALLHELPKSLAVEADPVRIRQVVDNLLSNALKYTPAGGTVTLRLVEMLDDEVALVVSDTGIGIDKRELSRLFTRFFRTHDAETRAIQGVGLGLAITKSIVESHDGHIDVQSRAGEGSTFTVVLPRSGPHGPADTPQLDPVQADPAQESSTCADPASVASVLAP
jgi:two-component system, OmpR family, phosphate regulon sensor histidine kinase PhoR